MVPPQTRPTTNSSPDSPGSPDSAAQVGAPDPRPGGRRAARGARVDQRGCGSKPMVPFWGRCTTHFSLFSWDWDVHWGYGVLTRSQMEPRTKTCGPIPGLILTHQVLAPGCEGHNLRVRLAKAPEFEKLLQPLLPLARQLFQEIFGKNDPKSGERGERTRGIDINIGQHGWCQRLRKNPGKCG